MPETELPQKSQKAASPTERAARAQRTSAIAPVAASPRAKGVLRRTDVLGMQHSVGNRTAVENVRARGATGLISRTPATPLVIQRASFSELMAFWKKQELGQETTAPSGPKPKGAPNLPPQVTTAATGETAALNPVIENPKEAENNVAVSSPISITVSGSGKSDSPGWGKGTPPPGGFKKTGSGVGGALVTPVRSGSGTHFDSLPSNMGKSDSNKGGALLTMSGSQQLSSTSQSSAAGGGPVGSVDGNKTQVKYLATESARKEFQLDITGTIKQGDQPYDTSKMYSKFKGDGFGIYVMSKDGRFFSTSHKIGLFHHSSFLGGGDVAGAGEMKVVGGELKYLTNKSGHYWPGDRELAQTIDALKKAGTSGLGTATLAQLMPSGGMKDPYPGGPDKFLDDHPVGGTYTDKPMNDFHKGEDKDSVKLVKEIIRSYVPLAQKGKLKKFTTANGNFGKTFDDIKALVLAEFGWTDEDTVTYKAVLETWESDAPITGPKTPPTNQGSSPILLSSSIPSPTVSTGSSVAEQGSTSGRDWDAELKEIEAKGNVDWAALGLSPHYSGSGWVIQNGASWSYPTAKNQVQLALGEVTIDQIGG